MAMPIALPGPLVRRTAVRRSAMFTALTAGLGIAVAAIVLISGSIGGTASSTAAPASSAFSAAPAGLQTAASAAVGAQTAQYSVRHQSGSLVSAGGGLSTIFATSGPVVQVGSAKLALSLAGVGYGTQLSQFGSAVPVATGSQVSYRRAGITEWYRNGPLGLEQGFTLSQRPAGNSAQGLLTVAVRASGPLKLAQQGANVVVTGSTGATVARYGGLTAVDASGRMLASKLVVQNGTLLLRVNDAGARYPLTIDPLLQEGSKLVGTGATGNAGFGGNPSGGNPSYALYRANIAISTDGTTAVIGGAADNANVGAVWIFTQSGGVWTQQGAKLTGTGETGAGLFGSSVALSSDGNTALIGAPADNSSVGAAFVFTRSAGVWTQQTVTPLTGAAGGESGSGDFGSAVALSADGNTALIGARGDAITVGSSPPITTHPGTAYPFTRSAGSWAPQGTRLIRSDSGAAFLAFGAAVALSADGNTALIGASADGNGPGAAYVFFRTGTTWAQQAKIIPSDTTASSHAGMSVALSSDGNTALIGGSGDTSSDAGAAWIFTRSGTTWTQFQSKLTPSDETGFGFFGSSVALSQDGTLAVIGASQNASATGGAWSFKLVNGLWEQNGNTFVASDETGAGQLGGSVAISGDGSQFLAGANADNGGVGAAFAFHLTLPVAPTNVTAVAADGQATVSFTAPTTNGGPITEFTAISHPDGHYWQGTSSPITVSGLTDGTSYTFTVVGDDSVGTGPESADSNAVTPAAPAPTPTTTTKATTPTVTATATPTAAGSVTSTNGTSVAWPAGTFSTPVTVSATPATGLSTATTLAAGTVAIQLVITNAAGVAVTEFSAPVELVFPVVPATAIPAYSHDGINWTAIPELTGTTLPAGYPDGWYRDASGTVHVLTLHATDFGALAAGSKVTSALQLSVGVKRTLNLNYGHKLTVYLHSTLPASSTITLTGKAKAKAGSTIKAKNNALTTYATSKPALTGNAQIVTITLPKTARHIGAYTLTLTSSAASLTTSQAIKIAVVAHWNKKG